MHAMVTSGNNNGPFRTIGDVSAELNLPTHILRYWETRFPQLRPLTRAGNRRYYRPEDVDLARRINHLLNVEGYTIKGAQKALSDGAMVIDDEPLELNNPVVAPAAMQSAPSSVQIEQLKRIRDRLQMALDRS